MAPKVILISLDGATDTIVDKYLQNGVLDAKTGLGFLKSKGVAATDNETVTPSLTAPSHIAIATGSTAVNNDINANSFHLIGNPFTTNTSGFAAPIGGYTYQSGIDPSESTNPTANPLAGVAFQRALESHAYVLGGSNYQAPAQLVGDFLANRPSTALGTVEPSYTPGVTLTNLASALPDYAIVAMREALPAFAKKIPGFDRDDAVLTGVETRTSSPMRMTRGEDCQSLNVRGIYPAGEGAGYAGGILSAGVDGIKVAEALAADMVRPS